MFMKDEKLWLLWCIWCLWVYLVRWVGRVLLGLKKLMMCCISCGGLCGGIFSWLMVVGVKFSVGLL